MIKKPAIYQDRNPRLQDDYVQKLVSTLHPSLVSSDDTLVKDSDIEIPESRVIAFYKRLFKNILADDVIHELFYGLPGHNDQGVTEFHPYMQVYHAIQLYNDLKNNFPLFEIGTKRVDREALIKSLETILSTVFEEIGAMRYGISDYTLFQEPKHGVLLSTYVQEWDHWYMEDKKSGKQRQVAICNSSYCGVILPGFALTKEVVRALNTKVEGQIEWPYNRLGGLPIDYLFKRQYTPKRNAFKGPIPFKLEFNTEPKVVQILKTLK